MGPGARRSSTKLEEANKLSCGDIVSYNTTWKLRIQTLSNGFNNLPLLSSRRSFVGVFVCVFLWVCVCVCGRVCVYVRVYVCVLTSQDDGIEPTAFIHECRAPLHYSSVAVSFVFDIFNALQ